MGEKITLAVEKRDVFGKKVASLRKAGLVPAVVYGAGMKPESVQVKAGELAKVVHAAGYHTPVQLTGAKRRIAMIKEIEIHPVKGSILHVGFHAVKADEPVLAEVPIRLVGHGESEAEKSGLVILQALDKIQVKALPMDLPEALEVSTAGFVEAGEHVTVADISLPAGVEIVDNDNGREDDEEQQSVMDLVIASVYEPSALQAQNEAAAGDAETADADEVEAENGDDSSKEDAEVSGKGDAK